MKQLICLMLALLVLGALPALAESADDGVMRQGLYLRGLRRQCGLCSRQFSPDL